MVHKFRLWARCLLLVGLTGCAQDDLTASILAPAHHQEAERWQVGEHPSALGRDLEYRISQLPTQGQVRQTPWPGSHWPLSEDGLNARWDGPASMSAIEKYGQATGVAHLEDAVSMYYGLDGHRAEGSCRKDTQCPRHKPRCGKRRGKSVGVCVGVWWGVCHGWSPASISEVEPQHAVVYQGVEFKVNDIKALLTLAYASSGCTQLGQRSETGRFKTDLAGRAIEDAIRQLNPGTFHVAVANMVGLRQMAITIDRDLSYRVFNHPVASYKVTRLDRVDTASANRLLSVNNRSYPYTRDAAFLYNVSMDVSIVMDTQHHEDGPLVPTIGSFLETRSYTYILEADARGLVIGGEWLGKSKLDHPDFLWRANGLLGTHRAGGTIKIATIKHIAEMSRQ